MTQKKIITNEYGYQYYNNNTNAEYKSISKQY